MNGKSLLLFNNCVDNYVAVMITNVGCLFNKMISNPRNVLIDNNPTRYDLSFVKISAFNN